MSRKCQRRSENEGEFLWLVSLSDLMILLFVFFVVLFSFSFKKMDSSDFQKISESFAPTAIAAKASPLDDIQAKLLKWVMDRDLLDSVDLKRKEDSLILEIKEKLLFESGKFSLKGGSKDLIFVIGSALKRIPAPYRIGIEGHTDDVPLKQSADVRDNWELSSRRAHSVLRALELPADQLQRTVLMGYGEYKPLIANLDENGKPSAENRSKNRRVTIRIF